MSSAITIFKRLAGGLIAATLALGACTAAQAQAWPSKPIRLVVPFGPGGGNDLIARMLQQKLSEGLGQPVVVDNRAGGSGVVGTQFVQRAAPDGYTIVIGGTPLTVNQTLQKDTMVYDVLKDFTPISLLVLQPNVLLVHPGVQAKSVKELLAMAKAQPGKLDYGTGSIGSAPHLSGELLKVMAGVDVTMLFDQPATSIPHIRAGKVRPLAVTSAQRSPQLPEVPTMAESGLPGYEVNSWFGILAPAGVPRDIVNRLSSEFSKAVNSPEIKDKLLSQGFAVVGSGSDEMGVFMRQDVANFKKIIEAAKITVPR